jgi:hypothetical protein
LSLLTAVRESEETRVEPARLTTVMGVARALLRTHGPKVTASVLVAEYGWDRSFQGLAVLREPAALVALGLLWEDLLLAPLDEEFAAQPAT